ncbi:expressed protein [Chlorella variabilis]|uniref:Expressed protein n=1 Tax=Chlorella variabilis TaxID=554065 RepID=E1ZFI2_CHLVA|nr:expressed protein [Chlorella variabilis]EFN55137.1 expressed protein [Chlorella variabilis]|eukprot:XP_005847239.1 expressed protein [Chlorella variabilis]
MADGPVGYLVINVLESAGHDSDDQQVWEPDFKSGYARVEIRGGAKTIKKFTSTQSVADNGITWVEQLTLEVLEGASELRIMLCRPKEVGEGGRSSSSIVAACGIYMKDILEAAPVDKYFELYKPGGGSAGGFIRVAISFLEPDQVRNGDLVGSGVEGGRGQKKKGGILGLLLKLGVLAAGAAAVYTVLDKQGVIGKKKEEPLAPAKKKK